MGQMNKLKTWRAENNLTIEEAAWRLRVSPASWHRWETDARPVPWKRVTDVSRVTGLEARDINAEFADYAENLGKEGTRYVKNN